MSKRKYGQVCALTQALDLIGERWTLVVVRELLFGPRRYSDLLRGMPGLGTNLLAQRLKDLEQANIITQRKLPPPASSFVYELTQEGRTQMTPIIRALTNFGVSALRYPPNEEAFVPASSTMGALAKFYHPERGAGTSWYVEFHTGEEVFRCGIDEGVLSELGFGTFGNPTLVLRGATDLFMGLIVGYMSVAEGIETGILSIQQGTLQDAEAFFALFEGPHAGDESPSQLPEISELEE